MAQPYAGSGHGRFNKTARKMFGEARRSERTPLSPVDKATAVINKMGAKTDFQITRASLSQEAANIRAGWGLNKAGIRASAQVGLDEMGSSMEERGMLGSTVARHGREAVLGERDAALAQGFNEKQQALLSIAQRRAANALQYRQTLLSEALKLAAVKQQASLDAYGGPTRKASDYKLDTSGANVKVGDITQDPNARLSGNSPLQTMLEARLGRIKQGRMGDAELAQRVAEVLGEAMKAPIPGAHHDGELWEKDFNILGGGVDEPRNRMMKVYKALYNVFGAAGSNRLQELIFRRKEYFGDAIRRRDDKDHFDHLHFGFGE